MSNSCGDITFLEGGTVKGSSVLNSQIVNSEISSSLVVSSNIETLSSVDAPSATTIINRILENITNVRNIAQTIAADEEAVKAILRKLLTAPDILDALLAALAMRPSSALTPLADALANSLENDVADVDAPCNAGDFPARIAGSSDYVLGKPDGWVNTKNGSIPVYANPCVPQE